MDFSLVHILILIKGNLGKDSTNFYKCNFSFLRVFCCVFFFFACVLLCFLLSRCLEVIPGSKIAENSLKCIPE